MLLIKRMCDVIGSIACIIILSPLLLLIGIITKFTVRGTAIFTQTRTGYLQNEFEIYKFRTIAGTGSQMSAAGNEEADGKIPPFSRFLRRTKLDELPQLINVLRGDMSFVGPRPYVREESIGLTPERYLMRPGITGLGQVNGNRELSWEERTAYDIAYIRHYSLLLDIKILLKTFLVIVLGEKSLLKKPKPLTWKDFQWNYADIFPKEVREGGFHRPERAKQNRKGKAYYAGEKDISLNAEKGHGKVTDCGYDRFPCVYTMIPANNDFRIEAEMTVVSFLHEPGPTHRESFGIFVRDTMEPDPHTGEYYANMAVLGGYYGRYNFFGRTGITPNSIENVQNFYLYPRVGSCEGIFSQDPLFYRICPERPIRIRVALRKQGSRITARMTDKDGNDLLSPSSNGGEGEIARDGNILLCEDDYSVLVPGAFSSRNTSWNYVGFEVADGSGLLVHKDSVKITLTKSIEDSASGEGNHQNAATGKTFFRKHKNTQSQEDIPAADKNDDAEEFTAGKTWIVTVDGTADGAGTEISPMSLQTAIKHCRPGQTVLVKAGTYLLDSSVCIEKTGSVSSEYRRVLKGENGHTVFDFQKKPNALIIRGDSWMIDGISVTSGHGIKVEGKHNIIRNCRAYQNLETGILIRHPDISSSRVEWPSGNLVENCLSYENRDPSECNADGFACKIASGNGNCFRNCISWLNSDDGFDLFTKNREIGSVTMERCQSYLNGYRIGDDGKRTETSGNGNGFKLGGSGLAVRHKVNECIAVGNKGHGFSSNSNPIMILDRCSAFRNGQKNCNYFFYAAQTVAPEKIFRNCNFENTSGFDAEDLQKELFDRYVL